MKLLIYPSNNDKYTFKLIYTKEEWEKLEQLYIKNGMPKHKTESAFEQYITCYFYRYPSDRERETSVLNRVIQKYYDTKMVSLSNEDEPIPRLTLDDNINRPLIKRSSNGGYFNLAIFRIVPSQGHNEYITEVEIELEEMLDEGWRDIGLVLKILAQILSERKVRVKWTFETFKE
jgi:hypothetical protein